MNGSMEGNVAGRRQATELSLLGFVVLWAVLDRTAYHLNSFSGEAGIAVCAMVLAVALAIEPLLSRRTPLEAFRALGLGLPYFRVVAWTSVLCVALLAFYPAFALVTGSGLRLTDGWLLLLAGLFAQGGIAEETVFRGFLFRRLRGTGTFWRGAARASVPFVMVHLLLFATLDFPVALAALLVSVSLSFPLAWLFETSGTIWPGALLHFIVQGSVKLVDAGEQSLTMALCWMALAAIAPWLVFLIRHSPGETSPIGETQD